MGIGISFWSDKTSKNDPTVKHRTVRWPFLPKVARDVLERYDRARLTKAQYYFVQYDGRPLFDNHFLEMLEVCLLHTRWRHVHIVSHSFRLSGASFARLLNWHIADIHHAGRWTAHSTAVEAYTRVVYMVMDPQDIYAKQHRYRKEWKPRRLTRLTHYAVQSMGGEDHVHRQMLHQHFPDYCKKNMLLIPASFPAPQTLYHIRAAIHDRESEIYLNKHCEKEKIEKQLDHHRRKLQSITRKATAYRMKKLMYPGSAPYRNCRFLWVEVMNRATQTERTLVVRRNTVQTQVTPIIFERDVHELQLYQQREARKAADQSQLSEQCSTLTSQQPSVHSAGSADVEQGAATEAIAINETGAEESGATEAIAMASQVQPTARSTESIATTVEVSMQQDAAPAKLNPQEMSAVIVEGVASLPVEVRQYVEGAIVQVVEEDGDAVQHQLLLKVEPAEPGVSQGATERDRLWQELQKSVQKLQDRLTATSVLECLQGKLNAEQDSTELRSSPPGVESPGLTAPEVLFSNNLGPHSGGEETSQVEQLVEVSPHDTADEEVVWMSIDEEEADSPVTDALMSDSQPALSEAVGPGHLEPPVMGEVPKHTDQPSTDEHHTATPVDKEEPIGRGQKGTAAKATIARTRGRNRFQPKIVLAKPKVDSPVDGGSLTKENAPLSNISKIRTQMTYSRETAHYKVEVDGEPKLVTAAEFHELFPDAEYAPQSVQAQSNYTLVKPFCAM